MNIPGKKGWWPVLFLVIAGIFVLIRQERNRVPDFSIRHPEKVYKIVLKGPSRSVIMVRKDEKWTFSNGNPVRAKMPGTFLEVLHKIEIKFPATGHDLEMARSDSTVEKITVHLLGRFFPVKKFMVYRGTSNLYGNLMTEREQGPSYICYLPGYKENLGNWFITRRNFWEPHLLFSYKPTEITMVELLLTGHPGQSFRLERTKQDSFILTDPVTSDTLKNMVVEKATRYLSYFHFVPFERFANGFTRAEADSIKSVPPIYIIKVSAINHPDKTARILPIRNSDGSRDPDRAIALINRESTPVVIRYFDLDPVLKERNYFSGKKPF